MAFRKIPPGERPPSSSAVIWARGLVRLSQSGLAQRLGLGLRTVALYESKGAPRWMRYTLAGLLLEKGKLNEALHVLEKQSDIFTD